jgi:hypothetical protein
LVRAFAPARVRVRWCVCGGACACACAVCGCAWSDEVAMAEFECDRDERAGRQDVAAPVHAQASPGASHASTRHTRHARHTAFRSDLPKL